MPPLDFQLRPRIVFGSGTILQLGEVAHGLGLTRVLVVSDEGVVHAGHFESARRSLEAAGVEVFAFHDFAENPTSDHVNSGVRRAADVQPDGIIGLGGGSSMDCAKGINFVYSCGGTIQDYWGVGKATTDLLPMIAVPTTAGTGSETQSFALISDAETHVKMACGDRRAACRVALLDPQLTVTQPRLVTALTGIDAISHAVESYVTKRRNPFSLAFSRQAFQLLAANFEAVLEEPENIEARGAMQLGAALAGMAIETSMLGAAHATANPLTARYDVVHGQAVGVMLPHVIRLNGKAHPGWYAELYAEIDRVGSVDESAAVELLAQRIEHFVRIAGLKTRVSDLGVSEDTLKQLAAEAAEQWTGTFNPVPLDHDNLHSLYEDAY